MAEKKNYAIISLGGKQYVVHEGERFLVERLDREEGKTFHPEVLFLGGEGSGVLAPKAENVTAKVVGHVLGPKVRIGKYKPKSGYKRHTGFRASLTQVEITTIGKTTAARTAAAKPAEEPKLDVAPKGLPKGYAELTVSAITDGAKGWNRPMLEAALAYEQEHGKRKGAIAALEHALAAKEDH